MPFLNVKPEQMEAILRRTHGRPCAEGGGLCRRFSLDPLHRAGAYAEPRREL
jgi:hypothetical protein